MIEVFPVFSFNEVLVAEDFHRFSNSFADILMKYLPTVAKVDFFLNKEGFAQHFENKRYIDELTVIFQAMLMGEKVCGVYNQLLLIPFKVKNDESVIAVISEADALFLQNVSYDWLSENAQCAEREFLILKQARVDAQTGLLNLSNLHYLLETVTVATGLHLILVELPPKRSSFRSVLRQSQKCTTLLLNYIKGDTVLHYLGQCTFALVLQHNNKRNTREIEGALVAYLRKEGCHRVHVGSMVSQQRGDIQTDSQCSRRQLLDEAWTAMCHARKRGPFTFCDYSLLAHPKQHPLALPDRKIVRRLQRLWAQSPSFCLIDFRLSNKTDTVQKSVISHLDRGNIVVSGDDVLVFMDQVTGDEIVPWVEEKLHLMKKSSEDIEISAGISSYPYCDFKKSEMVFNCKKALLHADLLGPACVAIFDGLSLNISGDIYFGDGDLAKAVKEYKRGLQCDKKNINLHNSLGVTLVRMNKLVLAMVSFENALELEDTNFMALYNYGLSAQTLDLNEKALSFLKKALDNFSETDGGRELENDLKLQIGILSCDMKRYGVALEYLIPWYSKNKRSQRAGQVYYYLGAAYHGINDNRKSMESLQRALRFNELDDRAMHLLGRIYFAEKEGDKIALSLCGKSVELEPADVRYRFHLAKIQLHCGRVDDARNNLRRCLKNKKYKAYAQLYMARSYVADQQQAKAKSWYKKLIGQEDVKKEFEKEALKALSMKRIKR